MTQLTRAELLAALTVERFGRPVREYHNDRRDYETEIAVARREEDSTSVALRRYELDIAVEDEPDPEHDPEPSGEPFEEVSGGASGAVAGARIGMA